jgi:hypothetical protein
MRWFIVFGSMAIAADSVGFAADPPRKVKPVVVWTGTDSKQAKDSFARCGSPKDWQATWNAHCGQEKPADLPTCPEVDFDSYMVIAVFRKTSRIRVSEIVEEKECVRVRYQPWGNQIVFVPGPDAGTVKVVELGRGELDPDKPYMLSFAFVVLPKANKAVVLEEDIQDLIGKPPVWKERAKFPALMEK